ncbi:MULTISPECIES: pitrilysin family protein [Cyanophyceae]|uniref:M16 family metallopeptidase n=1 Tax=Cyanophyceae TaxID=3028117 RepID=UPI00016DC62D|nr:MULTISPECIES: pitrilysin family protein [Cyanophyceae]ACA98099.1 processing protease [Picosynechococcus sp. PCC 7002]SMQ79253.1 Predicted Zn-dependent peptidase [Synechococcus sp. 7002]
MVASPASPQMTHRTVLKNGITLIVTENPVADLVAARLFFPQAGGRWESLDQAGLFHLLAAVITKGTSRYSAVEIAEQIESIGASLGASASNDYVALSLKTVTKDFYTIFKLAAEILREPTFPPEEVELERKITLQNIRSQMEQPFNVAYDLLRSQMYPQHPYGQSILGTAETVARFTAADLQQAHQTHFRPDNLVISLSGRLTLEQAEAIVEQTLGDWQNPTTPLPSLEIAPLQPQGGVWTKEKESQQAIIILGYLTGTVADDDFFALKLLSTYLGNGLSSRLFVELREKQGLAYDVSAFFPTRLSQSQFITYIGTAPQNTAIALNGLHQEIQRLVTAPLSEADLQIAKNKLLGQYALGKQTNAELAQIFGWYESIGLGIDFDQAFQHHVEKITTTETHQAAQRHFHHPYVSVVGSQTALSLIEDLQLS